MFGNSGNFTDHTYDYLDYAPRTYATFYDIAAEAGLSRFYAGIHYKQSIEIGLLQGERVVLNIFSKNNKPEPIGKYNS